MPSINELVKHKNIYKNSHKSELMEKAIKNNEGVLGPHGELIVYTGSHTGRSANDKYVVMNEASKENIWWENNINEMSESTFARLTTDVITYLESQRELYFTERSIGAVSQFALGIEFISTHASTAFFTQYIFKNSIIGQSLTNFKIYHAPNFELNPKIYDTNSSTVIVSCFKTKTTIIVGTLYAGEVKKSMFSVMNFLTPDHGILPMHSGANQNPKNESFVFFGLSGTGKTTLSTDEGVQLIGDDEHGLSDKGVFNFEGGCYAKTFKLAASTEPEIYAASTRFSSFLENVKINDDRSELDFSDDSITENGRSSYPLSFIENRAISAEGFIPKDIFYLSADAFGVLPPVSLLTPEQAIDYFVLGYSAKLAGTEVDIKTPQATFSACFGAPFMLRRPQVYSALLKKLMMNHKINVWLINTGWFGGPYGTGKRFPLKTTRAIIRQIQDNKVNISDFVMDEIFNLKIPKTIEGVESSLLISQNAWEDKVAYQKAATQLSASFNQQLIKLKS